MKKIWITLALSLVMLCAVIGYVKIDKRKDVADLHATIKPTEVPLASLPEASQSAEMQNKEEEPTIEIVMVGDMLMHTRVLDCGLMEDGSYSYHHLFSKVESKVKSADLSIVNQETILGGTELGLSSYPSFNSPYELGDAEVAAGFNVILHGTNHALDKGAAGITNCMNFWNQNHPEIAVLGIHDSKEDQEEIYVYEKDGIKIAVLNYTYGTNGVSTPDGMSYCVDYLTEERVRNDTARANELADFVVVCPHWGTEYRLSADDSQKAWCELFLECGVDLVIGTHPHVIEPVEMYEDEDGNQMLVYYSLGNFVNGTESVKEGIGVRMIGGMADVTVGYDKNGRVSILDYNVIPVVCHEEEGTDYTVYFLKDYTESLAQRNWIVQSDANFSKAYCDSVVEEVWENYQ